MCGPLDVSHLFIFTQSERTGNVSLKIARTPSGPTITFQVVSYSLAKDIKRFLRRPKSLNAEMVMHPPLLVLNGFKKGFKSGGGDTEGSDEENVEKLVVSMFQNIFPALNPARTKLSSIRRVFMIDKDPLSGDLELRHYFIDIKDVDISKGLKRLFRTKQHLNKKLPNLKRKEDISSLILDRDVDAYTSESEVESEVEQDSIVRVVEPGSGSSGNTSRVRAKKTEEDSQRDKMLDAAAGLDTASLTEEQEGQSNVRSGVSNENTRKKAIRLSEVGPRLTLKLVKIEEGICTGRVIHHEFIKKTDKEIEELERQHQAKEALKAQRRKEQEANVARKNAAKEAKRQRKLERRKARQEQEGQMQDEEGQESEEESSGSEDVSSGDDSDTLFSDE